jgi:hypothetical protein
MFRLQQTLMAQRHFEALLQKRQNRRAHNRVVSKVTSRSASPSPKETPFLSARRRRRRSYGLN